MSDESPATPPENPYSTLLAILGGGVALALIIFAIGFATRDSGGGGGGEGGGGSVPVSLTEFKIGGTLNVASGGTLAVSNDGTQVHNLTITGDGKTADLNGGDSEDLKVDVDPGTYEVFCSIPGHKEAGMVGTLTVTAGGGESASGATETTASEGDAGAAHGGSGSAKDYIAADNVMVNSFRPFVDQLTSGKPATQGKGAQDLEPTIAADGAKEWTITAAITDWEVEPGKVVKAWTFNGTVPGPTLRGEVGDRIRVKFINKLPEGLDIHMHGMILPNLMDGVSPVTQALIQPGQSGIYEYTVTEPGVAMYHPHAHGANSIPNGMWGNMIFSPAGGGGSSDWLIPRGKTISGVTVPADVQPVIDQQMVLNDAGVIGLSLNGKSFPGTAPYAMNTGDWALMHYYSEGLVIHTMHLHQFPQLVIARDGIPLDAPYWADTLNIGPGERWTVLFQANKPGAWVWHCHVLTHAETETRMIGMVTAIAVSDPSLGAATGSI